MTYYAKIASVLVLLLLASPVVIFMKGCGDIVNGGACGGCPDTTAPYGSTVTITTGLKDAAVTPFGGCYDNVTFTFTDPDNQPLNGICVEIFTNGFIKKSSDPGDCTSYSANYVSGYLRTRTDEGGTAMVDFATGDLSSLCTAPGTQTLTFFVQVSSCTVADTSEATLTLTCP